MHGRRIVTALAAVALLAAGCEEAFQEATEGMEGSQTAVGVPREIGAEDPTVDGFTGENATPLASSARDEAPRLVHSPERNGGVTGQLDRAEIMDDFTVRLEGGGDISRVEWWIDGTLFRDDDVEAPYNLRYFGSLPIGTPFASDQGLPGEFEFVPGWTHVIEAVIHGPSGTERVAATFDVGAPDALPPAPGGFSLVESPNRNGADAGPLAGAVLDDPFAVRLQTDGRPVDRVVWRIDGRIFRNDDVDVPYNLRYTGTLPIGEAFTSDQGLPGEWRLGGVHVIDALVRRGDRSMIVSATFSVTTGAGSAPATTAAPTTTTAPPAPTTTAAPPATTAAPTTTTAAPVPTTTAAPPATTAAPTTTTAAPSVPGDPRPVVMADASTVLDRPNTIYDFGFGSPGEVVILASNVEARNIRGPGARRIGARNGVSITDSGFRNFEFTFAHVQMSDGATITRPYFIDGVDVNAQPNVGDGDIMQFFAYEGDIIEPLVDNVTVYGKRRPDGSDAHNDGIQYTGMSGGRVWNPIIRNSTVLGASSAAVQAKHVHGLFTIENNALSERYGSYHAVIAKPGDSSSSVLWRDNTMINGASAAMTEGWSVAAGSNGVGGTVLIE